MCKGAILPHSESNNSCKTNKKGALTIMLRKILMFQIMLCNRDLFTKRDEIARWKISTVK